MKRNEIKTERDSNLELFRIIVMLFIVAHHYVVNSGLIYWEMGPIIKDPLSVKSLTLLSVGAFGKSGINCFMMITGYYMCKGHITMRKYVKVLSQVVFYNVAIGCIFFITGYSAFTLREVVTMLFPVCNVQTNFTGCYLLFFLCIPFLNILIHSLSQKQHLALVLLSSFIYVFYGTIPRFDVSMNYVSWFCVIYFLASYIRLYPRKVYSNTKLWGVLTVIALILSVVSVVLCTWLGVRTGTFAPYQFVSEANNFLAVAVGLCSFMLFKNIRMRNSRFINVIASTTFGVLCIHANSGTMRKWLWEDLLNNIGAYYTEYWLLHFVGSVISVFAVCSLIEYLRQKIVEKPILKLWDKLISKVSKKFQGSNTKLL